METEPHHAPHQLEGEFIVAVGCAVALEIDPTEGAGVPDSADRAISLVYASPVMQHTVEYVDLSFEEVHGAKRAMYMMQRASSGEQRDQRPASYTDPYDVLCYVDDWRRRDDERWRDAFERRQAKDRFKTEPPEWVAQALDD